MWSAVALPKKREVERAVRNYALLPGPVFIRESEWIGVHSTAVCAEVVC